jgi:diguanylate cyclase (GGDEF)-like protein/PAS domain S-box-containing protein
MGKLTQVRMRAFIIGLLLSVSGLVEARELFRHSTGNFFTLTASLASSPFNWILDSDAFNQCLSGQSPVNFLLFAELGCLISWALLVAGLYSYCIPLVTNLREVRQDLQRSNEELETLVEARTAQLEQANQQLQQEVVQRTYSEVALRKRTAELKERLHQHLAVAQLGQQGIASTDLSILMQEVVILVAQTLSVEYCEVLELLPGESAFLLRAGVGWQDGLVGLAKVGTQASYQAGYTLMKDEPVIVEDLRVETRFSGSPLLHNHKVISGATLVIPGKKQPYGILGVHSTQERQFTKDDVHFLQAIANVLAAAIERYQSEAELYLLKRAINSSSNGIVIADAVETDNPVIYVNPSFERLTGYKSEEIVGRNCRLLQGADTHQPALEGLRNAIATGRECRAVLRNYRKDGTLFWNELYTAPVYNTEGYLTHFIGVQTDVTERKDFIEALEKSEEQFRLTFELAPIGMVIATLGGKFLRVNQALCDAVGYTTEELLNLTLADITHPDDLATNLILDRQLLEGTISEFQLEKRYLAKDGRIVNALLKVALVRDSQHLPLHFIAQIVDVTQHKQMEERLRHDAFHDPLTGLSNRALFIDRLKQALNRAKRYNDYLFAVLFLDLDRFKVVNDSVGHMVGDQLLIAIARKLELCLRPIDTVARLGGDEFTILLDNIQDHQDAISVAERIHHELVQPFNLDGHEIFTSASIGIALYLAPYDQPEDLLRDADIALYRAKEMGKARHEIFDKEMHAHVLGRLQLETDLRRALRNQEFHVYYQPITSLVTGKLTGFEALIRWQHPERGLVSPVEFIPIAEETGLIVPIGQWILQEACATMQVWQKQFPHLAPLTISVNLSGKQLREQDLIEQIDQVLAETHLDGHSLKLEITESILMDNAETVTEMLLQLRKRHIQLSIDDFGTGYSSLSYLHRFPVNTLKIDRSFVSRMNQDDENSKIVRAIVSLAHTLKMDVIAEGVETRSQLHQLQSLECEQGQGYLFSKPLDVLAAEILLAQAPTWEGCFR